MLDSESSHIIHICYVSIFFVKIKEVHKITNCVIYKKNMLPLTAVQYTMYLIKYFRLKRGWTAWQMARKFPRYSVCNYISTIERLHDTALSYLQY